MASLLMALLAWDVSVADDWPQWMGPDRDGVYRETGVVDTIPDAGLPVLWRQPTSHGYAGPAVAAGRVLLADYLIDKGEIRNDPGARTALQGRERVRCLDATNGQTIWEVAYERPYEISYPNGPRATPTIDGDRVYVLGAEGDLLCLAIDDGRKVWHVQLKERFATSAPIWGYAAHPLVYGDLLVCMVGGADSAVVAMNKYTGEVVWQALTADDIGYCPPNVHRIGGRPHLIIWHARSINALNPENGQLLWTFPLEPRYGMAIAAPRVRGNRLFATGIGQTAVMLPLGNDGHPGEPLWTGRPKMGLYAGNATPVFAEDAIYGSDCETGQFMAIDPDTGRRLWETFELTTGGDRRASHGTAFVVPHEEKYFVFTETGDLVVAALSPEGFQTRGRMHVLEPTAECFGRKVVWSHPAFANRCLFARNDREIVCVSLQAAP
ncbi:MAG: pyrrolo-quinoline quinone [Planctomycetota bacterium]|nr:MAG: pyrrolo-quinoline quinone [Planctomycetota bacterium]